MPPCRAAAPFTPRASGVARGTGPPEHEQQLLPVEEPVFGPPAGEGLSLFQDAAYALAA
jgi:hypothetical protein